MPAQLLDLKVDVQLWVLLLTVCYAWWRGAGPEKACAAVLLAMKFVDWPYHWITGRGAVVASIDIGHLAIDLLAGASLWAICVRANRVYPIWLTAFQLIAIAGHFARDLSVKIIGNVYALMTIAPSYFLIVVLIMGTLTHHRRVMMQGKYPSWLS
jgi:hypothetical protein